MVDCDTVLPACPLDLKLAPGYVRSIGEKEEKFVALTSCECAGQEEPWEWSDAVLR